RLDLADEELLLGDERNDHLAAANLHGSPVLERGSGQAAPPADVVDDGGPEAADRVGGGGGGGGRGGRGWAGGASVGRGGSARDRRVRGCGRLRVGPARRRRAVRRAGVARTDRLHCQPAG